MKYNRILTGVILAAALCLSGCGKERQLASQVIAPAPTAVPTGGPEAVTATPIPTSTPAPRLVGVKTATAEFVYLANNTGRTLRELHLKATDAKEWDGNLISNNEAIKPEEIIQMYYAPDSDAGKVYDVKILDKEGNLYVIYNVDFGDMKQASLCLQGDAAYLSYQSLTTKMQTNTECIKNEPSPKIEEDGYYDENGEWISY